MNLFFVCGLPLFDDSSSLYLLSFNNTSAILSHHFSFNITSLWSSNVESQITERVCTSLISYFNFNKQKVHFMKHNNSSDNREHMLVDAMRSSLCSAHARTKIMSTTFKKVAQGVNNSQPAQLAWRKVVTMQCEQSYLISRESIFLKVAAHVRTFTSRVQWEGLQAIVLKSLGLICTTKVTRSHQPDCTCTFLHFTNYIYNKMQGFHSHAES